jgi:hypothetical protein
MNVKWNFFEKKNFLRLNFWHYSAKSIFNRGVVTRFTNKKSAAIANNGALFSRIIARCLVTAWGF